jgi:L,D-transpeptidase ErfK/SrfK
MWRDTRTATRLRALATGTALVVGFACPALAGDGDRASDYAEVMGSVRHHTIVGDETLLEVARESGLGYVELMAANPGIDPWLPGVGTEVVVPDMHVLPDAPRRGIVINLTEMRIFLFSARGDVLGTWPIGVGQQGGMTPLGTTTVIKKELNPTWFPPASVREEKPELPASVPPGPDNPLGDRALYLGWPRILIHGTNKPLGVGRRVSHGCIRLYPEHIVELYRQAPVGTPVTVVDQQIVLGWRDGMLYLQIHPSATQADQIEAEGRFNPEPLPALRDKVLAAAGDRADALDWRAVDRAAAHPSGVPVVILGGDAVPSREGSAGDGTNESADGRETGTTTGGPPADGRFPDSIPDVPPIH